MHGFWRAGKGSVVLPLVSTTQSPAAEHWHGMHAETGQAVLSKNLP